MYVDIYIHAEQNLEEYTVNRGDHRKIVLWVIFKIFVDPYFLSSIMNMYFLYNKKEKSCGFGGGGSWWKEQN